MLSRFPLGLHGKHARNMTQVLRSGLDNPAGFATQAANDGNDADFAPCARCVLAVIASFQSAACCRAHWAGCSMATTASSRFPHGSRKRVVRESPNPTRAAISAART